MKTITTQKDIVYGGKPSLNFDIYQPIEPSGNKPLILLIHGGGFENGSKEQPFYVAMSRTVAENGYPAVCLNYTLTNPSVCPAPQALDIAMKDVLAAISYIRRDPMLGELAKKGMVLLGDSAAGAIVVNIALDFGKELGIVGCVNMWGGMRSETAPTPWGGDVYWKEIEPVRAPAFLVLHGTADSIAGYDVSTRFKAALDRKAVPNFLIPLEGAEHYPEERVEDILRFVLEFLKQVSCS